MSSTHPTTTGLAVTDEGPDFTRFNLPAWISHDEVGELQRLANVHLAGLLAAHRVASAVRAKLSTGGVDEVAGVLGVEVDELQQLLTGASPGFTVHQLASIAALVGCRVSELVAAADESAGVALG